MTDFPLELDDSVFDARVLRAPHRTTGAYEPIARGDYAVAAQANNDLLFLNVVNIPRFIDDLDNIDDQTQTKTIGRRYISYVADEPTPEALRHTYAPIPNQSDLIDGINEGTFTCAACGELFETTGQILFIQRYILHQRCIGTVTTIFSDVWDYTDTVLADII